MEQLIVMTGKEYFSLWRMLEQAMCCPECRAGQSHLCFASEPTMQPRYAVICSRCKHTGRLAKTPEAAVKKWNEGEKLGIVARLAKLFGR